MNAQELTKIVNGLTNEMPDVKKNWNFCNRSLKK